MQGRGGGERGGGGEGEGGIVVARTISQPVRAVKHVCMLTSQ